MGSYNTGTDIDTIAIGRNNYASAPGALTFGAFTGFRLTTGASTGYVLTTDASGNARWDAAPSG